MKNGLLAFGATHLLQSCSFGALNASAGFSEAHTSNLFRLAKFKLQVIVDSPRKLYQSCSHTFKKDCGGSLDHSQPDHAVFE